MSNNDLFDMMAADAANSLMMQALPDQIGAVERDELVGMDFEYDPEVTDEMRDWVASRNWHVKGDPRDHQIRALFEANLKPGHCYFVDPGGGKTFLTISEICHLAYRGEIDGVLGFAPNGVHRQWIREEMPKWMGPDIPVLSAECQMSPGRLKDFLARNNKHRLNVLFLNYEGIPTDKNRRLVLDFLRKNRRVFVVVDESQKVKNWEARRTLGTMAYALRSDYRRILTGTPLLRGLEDLWSQYEIAHPGIAWPGQPLALHPSGRINNQGFIEFRAHHCVTKRVEGTREAVYIVGYKHEAELMERVAPYVTRVRRSEFSRQEAPDFIRVETPMSPEQRRAYVEMESDLTATLESETITVENALVQMGKLLQISSGFLYKGDVDETTGYKKNAEWHWLGNGKITAMMNIMENLDEPVLIWCPFRALHQHVLEALRDRAKKDKYWRRGIFSFSDDGKDVVDRWREDPRGVLVGNQGSSMGVGLNLQHAAANIYMCNTFSAEARWQSLYRTDRMGQQFQVRNWDLISPDTREEAVFDNLARKEDMSRLNIDGIRRFMR